MSTSALQGGAPTLRGLHEVCKQTMETREQAASGKRVKAFSDSPADAVSIAAMSSLKRSLQSQLALVEDRISRSQVADGGYAQVESVLLRIRNLQSSAQSASASDTEVAAVQAEIDASVNSLRFIYGSTSYGDHPALEADEAVQAVLDGGASANGDPTETLDALYNVAHRRASLGAQAMEWATQVHTLQAAQSNLTEVHSRIEDVDAAEQVVEATRLKLMSDGSISALRELIDVNSEEAVKLLS